MNPRSESFTIASGASLYAGLAAPPSYPAWRSGMTVMALNQIPGSSMYNCPDSYTAPQGRSKSGIYAYSGACLDPLRNRMWRFGGGHNDYAGNEVMMIDFNQANPVWRLQRAPTSDAFIQPDVAFYTDGRPSATHTYWGLHWNESRKAMLVASNASVWGNGNSGGGGPAFDSQTGDWISGFDCSVGGGSGPCWMGPNGDIFGHNRTDNIIRKWDNASGALSSLGANVQVEYETAYCYNSSRNIAFRVKRQGLPAGYFDHSNNLAFTSIASIGGPDGADLNNLASTDTVLMTYDPDADCIWLVKRYESGSLYKLQFSPTAPYSVTATRYTLANSFDWYASGGASANTYGGFVYSSLLKGILWNFAYASNTYFIPTE